MNYFYLFNTDNIDEFRQEIGNKAANTIQTHYRHYLKEKKHLKWTTNVVWGVIETNNIIRKNNDGIKL